MRLRRSPAVAIALLSATLAAAGCGFGPGERLGQASLTVTREYGAVPVMPAEADDVSESDTVMRVLDRNAAVSTRYGGGFVQSIEGIAAAAVDGRRHDWFFYVNGVESPVGAADFALGGGEAIWWDYRDWSAAARVPAVVGSWPRPLTGGYEGRRHPVALECRGAGAACPAVRRRLSDAGIEAAETSREGAIRVLVGPWARLREDPAAAQLEAGPQTSGIFADFARSPDGFRLQGLDEQGEPVRAFGPRGGLVAATRRYGGPPVWIISGATVGAARGAAELLDAAHLRNRYAVATDGRVEVALPVR